LPLASAYTFVRKPALEWAPAWHAKNPRLSEGLRLVTLDATRDEPSSADDALSPSWAPIVRMMPDGRNLPAMAHPRVKSRRQKKPRDCSRGLALSLWTSLLRQHTDVLP